MGCLMIIGIIVVAGLFLYFDAMEREAEVYRQEQYEKQEEERIKQRNRNMEIFEAKFKSIKSTKDYVDRKITSFFVCSKDGYSMLISSLKHEENNARQLAGAMKEIIEELEKDSNYIDSWTKQKMEEAREIITYINNIRVKMSRIENKMRVPYTKMLDTNSYGRINRGYWNKITNMRRKDAVECINSCEKIIHSVCLDDIYLLDGENVFDCIWFFATERMFSVLDFDRAVEVFLKLFRFNHIEISIANLYTKMKIGGEDAIQGQLREFLKGSYYTSETLKLVASGLMWMNAYRAETMVLQHMLEKGMKMDVKTQERLHALVNGGGNGPSVFDVEVSNDSLYFDVSALAWKENEYIGVFENLAFQDKALTYSFAIREEDKELFIAQDINIPKKRIVLEKLNSVFLKEYGSGVTAKNADCTTLSGSGTEKIDGILVVSDECKQMGIVIHIVKIGRKLVVKFYTLFMPVEKDLGKLKQQALSMYNKLSPIATAWESSLKDTMLMAIEQLLNANVPEKNLEWDIISGADEFVFK